VHDFVFVKIFQGEDDAGDKEPRFIFLELPSIPDMISHVPSIAIIHCEKELLSGLKSINHIN
jgi:hypothetical protein